VSRPVLVLLALAALGCGRRSSPTPPAPAAVQTTASVPAALQTVAQELVSRGFTISVSDAQAGVLTAARTRAQSGNDDILRCRGASGSTQTRNRVSTLTITVAARPSAGGSDVRIGSSTRTTYPGLTGDQAIEPNDRDCVSLGVVERRLVAALQGSTPAR
jgi:hypothetical protein